MEYKSNNNVVYSCKYHVVWCPKYRRKVFVIMPDHVHLLLEVAPQFGIHKAVKKIKGKSSRILRQEFSWLTTKLPTLWTNSYFVSTVGVASLETIKQYIENQKTSQRK